MCIIAAPEGVKALTDAHPDVDLYIGALDDHLNEHKYIVPGLGEMPVIVSLEPNNQILPYSGGQSQYGLIALSLFYKNHKGG